MAIAFVGATGFAANSGAGDRTFAYTCGSGSNRCLVVGFAADNAPGSDTITGVTYNGVAMTRAGAMFTANQNRNLYLYYLFGPATGTNNIVVSHSSSDYVLLSAEDYTGVDSGGLDATTVTHDSGGSGVASLTTSITTVTANAWTVLVEGSYDGGTPPGASTGDVRLAYETSFGTSGTFDSNGPIASPGSYAMTTTRSTSAISHIVLALKPAAGGSTDQPYERRSQQTPNEGLGGMLSNRGGGRIFGRVGDLWLPKAA